LHWEPLDLVDLLRALVEQLQPPLTQHPDVEYRVRAELNSTLAEYTPTKMTGSTQECKKSFDLYPLSC
jgi:hypothetical protein